MKRKAVIIALASATTLATVAPSFADTRETPDLVFGPRDLLLTKKGENIYVFNCASGPVAEVNLDDSTMYLYPSGCLDFNEGLRMSPLTKKELENPIIKNALSDGGNEFAYFLMDTIAKTIPNIKSKTITLRFDSYNSNIVTNFYAPVLLSKTLNNNFFKTKLGLSLEFAKNTVDNPLENSNSGQVVKNERNDIIFQLMPHVGYFMANKDRKIIYPMLYNLLRYNDEGADVLNKYVPENERSDYSIYLSNLKVDYAHEDAPFNYIRSFIDSGYNVDLSKLDISYEKLPLLGEVSGKVMPNLEGYKGNLAITLSSDVGVKLDFLNTLKNTHLEKLDIGELKPLNLDSEPGFDKYKEIYNYVKSGASLEDFKKKYGSEFLSSDLEKVYNNYKHAVDRFDFDFSKPIAIDVFKELNGEKSDLASYKKFYDGLSKIGKEKFTMPGDLDQDEWVINTDKELNLRGRADMLYNLANVTKYKEGCYILVNDRGEALCDSKLSSKLSDFRGDLGKLGDKVVSLVSYIPKTPHIDIDSITVIKGHEVNIDDVKDAISGDKEGAVVTITKPVDTSTIGEKQIGFNVKFKNGAIEDYATKVIVKDEGLLDKLKDAFTSYGVNKFVVNKGYKLDNDSIRPFITGLNINDKVKVKKAFTDQTGSFKGSLEVIGSDGKVTPIEFDYEVIDKAVVKKEDIPKVDIGAKIGKDTKDDKIPNIEKPKGTSNIETPKAKIHPKVDTSNNKLEEIIGKDRVETSYKASKALRSDTLVIASGQNFADALSSSNLVNKFGYKLILINKDTDIEKYLDKDIKHVIIVGGEKVIPPYVENKIKSLKFSIVRLGGSDRYATNEKVLRESGYKKVVIADGRNFPDSLSAMSLMERYNLGLKLVPGNYVVSMEGLNPIYTVGGENSVRDDYGTIRFGGANRYETNSLVNNYLSNYKSIVYTSGKDYADALSSANLLKAYDGVLVLTDKGKVNSLLKIKRNVPQYVLGGMAYK